MKMGDGRGQRLIGFVAAGMLLVLCGHSLRDSVHRFDGMVGMTGKNGIGCTCHSIDPTPSVEVWIQGPDTLEPGGIGIYTLSIVADSTRTAGFNIATSSGLLQVVDSTGTYWYEDEMTHALPKASLGSDTVSWQFAYVAPGSDAFLVDTLFSVANSTNQDTMATDADHWNFGEDFLIAVGPYTGIGESGNDTPRNFVLHQNYPNPFNPSTTVAFDLPRQATVFLAVFDVTGRLVVRTESRDYPAGVHQLTVEPGALSSGVFFYRLEALFRDGIASTITRKMTLLR